MPRRDALYQWTQEVTSAFPQLSKPQASVLALYSFGCALARSCSLTAVALVLAALLKGKLNSLRQRLRELYQPAQAKAGAKRGTKRQQLDVTTCFAPLLRWLLRDWPSRQLPLALDATTLGSRFVVLAVAVVYNGSAIPVAWKVLPALAKEAWQPHWLDLLKQLQGVLPPGYTAVAFTDRGLWARWLYQALCALGWHPMMRVNRGGSFRPAGWYHFRPLKGFAAQGGASWQGRGTAFSTKACQLGCTLLAYWGQGHAEPWLVLTDLPPAKGEAGWYALRAWVEQGFKDLKRGGLQWQHTRMADPERVQRLWLVLAVTTLWLVRVGGEAEQADAGEVLPELRLFTGGEPERPRARRFRLVSLFRRGWVTILAALIGHRRLPLGTFVPEPLPPLPDLPAPAPAGAGTKQVA